MISVLTITRNRTSYLNNLLKGLARSQQLPDECIVIHMNEPAASLGDWPFDCRHYTYEDADYALPLSKARNLAAEKSSGDTLIFLDVDCIPGEGFIRAYEQASQRVPDSVLMGQVRYLPKPVTIQPGLSVDDQFMSLSQPHEKRDPSGLVPLSEEENYGLFWSLSFALRRKTFEQLGGFTEAYPSYGAEDTDFSWKARHQQVALRWVPNAIVYHQYHESHNPPWNHFESIVHNAVVFYRNWGEWPMQGWLKTFQQAGCIQWSPEENTLTVLQQPEPTTSSSSL